MIESIQEFVSAAGKVDRGSNVVRGVKILGLESKNGRRYRPEAARKAIPLYEGAKVNLNHPKGRADEPREYQARLGHFRNVSYREGDGLYGDLHFNPKHPIAEQFLWDCEHAPNACGFSHNIDGQTTREGGKAVIEAIVKVRSVDLVAEPATTAGIFESTGDDEQFGDASARRDGMSTREFVSLVTGQPEPVTEWLAGDGAKLTKGEPQTESFEGPTIESTAEFLSMLRYGVASQDGFQPLSDGRRRRWN